MDAARWNRIEELLQAALDRDPDERDAFLDATCGEDASLRREIDELLAGESKVDFLSRSPAITLLHARAAEERSGQTIGHYRIAAKIGAGGMGEVYEAQDETLQRTVALKVLPHEFTSDPDRVRRFEQEAIAASRLSHPNIITIFEILHTSDAHLIATELIDGKTVRELLKESGRLDADRALDVAIQVSEALKAAHTAWIIHRDVKPENVMVRADGLVKVLDFGIAKTTAEGRVRPSPVASRHPLPDERGEGLTAAGAILGTAKYMSPEQARGEPLDGRTDLFSLGLVLQEMLTGERHGRLDPVPKDLQRIVRRLLRANREERYPTAGELLDDLLRVKRRRESRTARRMVGIGVLAVIVAIAVAAIAAVLSVSETWEERILRDGHTAAARHAVFSPDGTRIASCGEDGQILVWDFARRQVIASLRAAEAHKIAWSLDGKWIATGGKNGVVSIFDAKRFVKVRDLTGHRQEIGQLAFTPDSTGLVQTASSNILTDTATWRKVHEWPDGVSHGASAFLRGGRVIVISNGLRRYDVDTGVMKVEDNLGGNWMSLSPDGTQVFAIEGTGIVAFYRVRNGWDFDLVERHGGHQDHGRGTAWSPDGKLVASAADDIILWDPATRQKVARFEYPSIVWSIAFSPDGRWLMSTHGDGAVLMWDVAERRCAANFNGHSGSVRGVAFSPDGKRIASASDDHTVALWNVESGRKETVLTGHDTRVNAVTFFANGARVASTDQVGAVIQWDAATAKPVHTIEGHVTFTNYCIRVSPDERHLATTWFLYTLDGRRLITFQRPGIGQIYGNDFSPDGRWLATVSTENLLALWDMKTYEQAEKVLIPETRLISVSVSRDGQHLVTGEDQGAVRLFATNPLRELAILGRHGARVKSVAMSPDGKTAASAGDDGMIALWDIERRKLVARIGTHASPVYAIAFSPDGKRLVSGEHDRSVRVYTRKRRLWGFTLE